MEPRVVEQIDVEPAPPINVEYFPDTQTLVVDIGKKWGEGEQIGKEFVVFYDHDNNVAGFTLDSAEVWLKPLIHAVLAKQCGDAVPPVLRSIGGVDVPVQESGS